MLTSVECSTKANTLNYFNIHLFKLLNFLLSTLFIKFLIVFDVYFEMN